MKIMENQENNIEIFNAPIHSEETVDKNGSKKTFLKKLTKKIRKGIKGTIIYQMKNFVIGKRNSVKKIKIKNNITIFKS